MKLKVRTVLQTEIAVTNQLGVYRDPAAGVLAEYPVQLDDRDAAAGKQLAQHSARPHGGELIGVADEDELTAVGHGLEEMHGQVVVQHGDLVRQNEIGVQLLHRAKIAAVPGHETESLVDRRSAFPGGLLHTPGRASRGRTADDPVLRVPALVDVQDRLLDHGLAGAWAAGDDAQRMAERHLDGLSLLRREADAENALLLVDFMIQVGIDIRAFRQQLAVDELGKPCFISRIVDAIDHPLIGDKITLGDEVGCPISKFILCELRRFQQLVTGADKGVLLHTEMPLHLGVCQRVQERCVDPLLRSGREADAGCDPIRGFEARPCQLTEPVGMVLHNIHGLFPILSVELYRAVGGDSIGCEKGDHVARGPVGQIRVADLLESSLADTGDVQQLLRLPIQHLQRHVAEGGVDLFGDLRADALDLPGTEIADDALPGGDNDLIVAVHLELGAVLGVSGPAAPEVIAELIADWQVIAHGLEAGENVPGTVPEDLTGAVDRHHVAAGAGRVGISGIEQFFKLAEHSSLLYAVATRIFLVRGT